MNNSDETSYVNMVSKFRITEFRALLGAFNCSREGRKNVLKERVFELIRNKPPGFDLYAFLAKITEIYQRMQSEGIAINNNTLLRNGFHNQQRNVQAEIHQQHQHQEQRMYQHSQHIQQHRPMILAALLQTHRALCENNPNHQQTGSRSMITHNPNMTQPEFVRFNINSITTSNNSFTPLAQSLINVKLKKLPFYKVVGDVIKPTVLIGKEKCTLPFAAKVQKEDSFKISLKADHCNLVAMNRDISNGKDEYIYQVQIRICQIQQGCTEISDYMPLGIQIRLNDKLITLPQSAPNTRPGTEARKSPLPIDCTKFMKLNPNSTNLMILNWIPDDKPYIVSMHLVKILTSDILLKALQGMRSRSSEETKNYIIKRLTDVDPDLATTNYRFSLLCPLTKMRMNVPAKSINCEHLQCFDAISFLQMNEKKPTWVCPTCNSPCLYDEIQIENYFLEVVSSSKINKDIKEIEILADGTWKVYEVIEECVCVSDYKEKLIDIVGLDDSDSSNDNPINNLKFLNSMNSESIKSSFIDLTSSVEDEESKKEGQEQENEAQAVITIQAATYVNLKSQAQVQPQQAVTSSEQEVIEIDSPSLPSIPSPITSSF